MVNQPDFHASWSFWPRIFDPLWEPRVKVWQNCQIPSNFLSLLGQSEVLFGLLSEAIVKVADQDLVQLCVRKYLKLMKLKKISYCLTFDNFDFTRKIQDFFLFGKIRENKAVLYCLIVDHFDFTRKIAKIILKFVKKSRSLLYGCWQLSFHVKKCKKKYLFVKIRESKGVLYYYWQLWFYEKKLWNYKNCILTLARRGQEMWHLWHATSTAFVACLILDQWFATRHCCPRIIWHLKL